MGPQELEWGLIGRFEWLRVFQIHKFSCTLSPEIPPVPPPEASPPDLFKDAVIISPVSLEGGRQVSCHLYHLPLSPHLYLESVPPIKPKVGKYKIKPKNQRITFQNNSKILLICVDERKERKEGEEEEERICCSKRDRTRRRESIILDWVKYVNMSALSRVTGLCLRELHKHYLHGWLPET